MAAIQPRIVAEINPMYATQDVCDVIAAVCAFHPGKEADILRGIAKACMERVAKLEASKEAGEPAETPASEPVEDEPAEKSEE